MRTTEFDVRHAAGLLFGAAGAPQSLARTLDMPFDPIASVYCPLFSEGSTDLLLDRTLRWRALVDSLRADGAPETVLATAEQRLAAQDPRPATVALFIDSSGIVIHEEVLPSRTVADRASFTAPADLRPLLSWQHRNPAHLVVAVDRTGAEISATRGRGAPTHTRTVVGPDDAIEFTGSGGWAGLAQSRMHNRAEDSWHHNVVTVAEAVATDAATVDAEVVVVAGEAQSVQLLVDEFPKERAWVVHTVSGGRGADGSQEQRSALVAQALAGAAADQERWLLGQFREQRAYGGLAVEGAEQTLAALASDRVAVLIVAENAPSGLAWFAEPARAVFADSATAHGSGQPVKLGALIDIAIRSALLTGARVRVVPSGTAGLPADGIGGICRFV